MKKSLPSLKVIKIERIQNLFIWNNFMTEKRNLILKYTEDELNERFLFHGTSKTCPSQIYNSDIGFDIRYSNPGLYGYGIYFGIEASLSHHYSYKNNDTF